MKFDNKNTNRGFTLFETVIAIGVLAVLLTGFMVVFAPAAQGIRRSLSVDEADRLIFGLEQELTTLRPSERFTTGFEKGYELIQSSADGSTNNALLLYQYRADLRARPRADQSLAPLANVTRKIVGTDYVVTSMVRRKNDPLLAQDLEALEGGLYLAKCTQLIYNTSGGAGLTLGQAGQITDPTGQNPSSGFATYPEAVIAFNADLYLLSGRSIDFISSPAFNRAYQTARNPVVSRSMAIRR